MGNHWINFRRWVRQLDSCLSWLSWKQRGEWLRSWICRGQGDDVAKWLGTGSYILRKTGELNWGFQRKPSVSSGWKPPWLKGMGTFSAKVRCCLEAVATCPAGFCAFQTDLTSGRVCVTTVCVRMTSWATWDVWGSLVNGLVLPLLSIFFFGFIPRERLLASALTSHHFHGDRTMVS